jgi:hypothetical protein
MRMLKRARLALWAGLAVWQVAGIAYGRDAQDIEDGQYIVSKKSLDCSPKILKGDQTLTLTLGPGHGSELAIRRLKGEVWYYLVMVGPDDEIKPLMTPEEYASARSVEIPAATKERRSGGSGIVERIFSKPGRYIVYSSDNLETEDGGYICVVDYVK